jgi:hypothetical protein
MVKQFEWTKEVYERSASGNVLVGYDTACQWDLDSADEELKQIVAMETELGNGAEWADSLGLRYLAPCGHYMFPEPFLQVLSLVGSADLSATKSTLKHHCYAVDRDRKKAAMDYCLCLDAWLAGARPQEVAPELDALGHRKIDWQSACRDLWGVLGERSERKELLVELTLRVIRHAIKTYRWDDEQSTDFGRDEYLGQYREDGGFDETWTTPRFDQWATPRLKRTADRLSELWPEWRSVPKGDYGSWWLCAPKAFRFLERDLWAIGKERPLEPSEPVPGFLQCEDTYPDHENVASWYADFCAALEAWWKDEPASGKVADDVAARLGEPTPVKRWLVRLFRHKLRMYEKEEGLRNGWFARLLSANHAGKRGTKPLATAG